MSRILHNNLVIGLPKKYRRKGSPLPTLLIGECSTVPVYDGCIFEGITIKLSDGSFFKSVFNKCLFKKCQIFTQTVLQIGNNVLK